MATPINDPTQMEFAEFQRILNIGLGRAILYLQQHSASPYRDAILYACLNVPALDPQLEGSRADYLWEVLQLTGEVDSYKQPILEALAAATPSDDHLVLKLFDLAFLFAEAGHQQAKEIIHQKFVENTKARQISGADHVIALDGLDGLILVMDQVIAVGMLPDFAVELKIHIDQAEHDLGEEIVWSVLRNAAQNNQHIKTFLASWQNTFSVHRHSDPLPDYQMARQAIVKGRQMHMKWQKWVADVSEHLFRAFSYDLITEQDPERLASLIDLFRKRTFPLDPQRLLQLAEHGDDRIEYDRMALLAINALERINHPNVRSLALRMIENGNRVGRAVGLLQNNFEPDDWHLITEITKKPLNSEDYHNLGFSVRDVFEHHPSEEAAETFINLYENGACSQCRKRNVKILHRLNKLPHWMLEECKYDSSFDLREQVRRGFSNIE